MAKCTECGKPVPDSENECPSCGAVIESAALEEGEKVEGAADRAEAGGPGRKVLAIIIIVVLLGSLIGALIWLFKP